MSEKMRMIVVDDDPLVRTVMRSMVNWDELGITIEGEASNGEEGLMLSKSINPDIIVTDIKMPLMDGLKLIEEVKRKNHKVLIIVLSCYDDFSLVRQAFQLGAFDYVLKPEMDENKLTELFRRVIKHMENEASGGHVPSGINEIIHESRRDIIDAFFKKLIWSADWNEQWVKTRARELGLRLKPENPVLCTIAVASRDETGKSRRQDSVPAMAASAMSIIESVLDEFSLGDAFIKSEWEYIIIFSFEKNKSRRNIREILLNICTILYSRIETYMNISTSIAVSGRETHGYEALGSLYKECLEAKERMFILGRERIVFYNRQPGRDDKDPAIDLAHNLKKLRNMLETNQLEDGLEGIMLEKSRVGINGISNAKRMYEGYATVITEHVGRHASDGNVAVLLEYYYKVLKKDCTLDELNTWLKSICKEIRRYQEASNYLVMAAKNYIHSHYNKPISLADAAGFLHVSQEHLCRVFSRTLKINFMKYLMKVRVEKAKDLIAAGELKLYEIAEKVGYTSVEYFSKMFKKVTGVSPREYGNTALHKPNDINTD